MARTGFFHHVGSFLLLAATVLLLVTTISAPVVNDIALLKIVKLGDLSTSKVDLTFGTFGYCLVHTDIGDQCTGKHIGYDPAAVIESAMPSAEAFSHATASSMQALTHVMVLHPVAAAVAFVAFVLAAGAGVVGSFLGSVVSLFAFLITLTVLVTDFVLFHLIKKHVDDTFGLYYTTAKYSSALWTLLVAALFLLLGSIIVFFSCCSARRHRAVKA